MSIKKIEMIKNILLMEDASNEEIISFFKCEKKFVDNDKLIKFLFSNLNTFLLDYSSDAQEENFMICDKIIDLITYLSKNDNFSDTQKLDFHYKQGLAIMSVLSLIKININKCSEAKLLALKEKLCFISFYKSKEKSNFKNQIKQLEEDIQTKRKNSESKHISQNEDFTSKKEEYIKTLFEDIYNNFIESVSKKSLESLRFLYMLCHIEFPNKIDLDIIKPIDDLLQQNSMDKKFIIMLKQAKNILSRKKVILNMSEILEKFDVDLCDLPQEKIGKSISEIIITDNLCDSFSLTIDSSFNYSSKDDAVSVKTIGGDYLVGIHITDVQSIIRKDSYLDIEARKRCKSIYLPDRIIKMLPENFVKNYISLEADELRNVISIYLIIGKTGTIKNISIKEEQIKVDKNLSYEYVDNILLYGKKSSLKEQLNILKEISCMLSDFTKDKERYRAIKDEEKEMFEELNTELDLLSHRIIEEFMIAYNRYFAQLSCNKNIPIIFRTHDKCDYNKVKVDNIDDATALLIGLYPKAKYSDKNTGHYGLNEEYYSHSSAPLRRYADLYNQYVFHLFNCDNISDETIESLLQERKKLIEYCNQKEKLIKVFESEYYNSYKKTLKSK